MELKDVILSTLAEMEDVVDIPEIKTKKSEQIEKPQKRVTSQKVSPKPEIKDEVLPTTEVSNKSIDSELVYLKSIKERLLVLFEGFQAPNNTNIEAKIDMTLNFLEYVLATIEQRVEYLEKGNR